jgi:hypothetical protein
MCATCTAHLFLLDLIIRKYLVRSTNYGAPHRAISSTLCHVITLGSMQLILIAVLKHPQSVCFPSSMTEALHNVSKHAVFVLWGVVSSRRTHTLEDHPLSVACNCLFNIYAAGCHGTHLTRPEPIQKIAKWPQCYWDEIRQMLTFHSNAYCPKVYHR